MDSDLKKKRLGRGASTSLSNCENLFLTTNRSILRKGVRRYLSSR